MFSKICCAAVLLYGGAAFSQQLTTAQADHLATLPLKCLFQQYPNKPGETLSSAADVQQNITSHPAFYGCFDWHSSVHGHWSLVYLLDHFPDLAQRAAIIQKLQASLTRSNIEAEIAYFNRTQEKSYERTYGWSWLLKLQTELDKSNVPEMHPLAENLQPLTQLLVSRYVEFLPKLLYPLRVGTHTSTAFGLSLAWDYAKYEKDEAFQKVIRDNAVRLFLKDRRAPLSWEPSGNDFLSPALEEVGIMQRVLGEKEFLKWAKSFMPQLFSKHFDWEPGRVSDRTDGYLVHLDGLNFSRAWNFYHLISQYPKTFGHLRTLADRHLQASLPAIVDGNYEGEHWLASFALHAFEEKAGL
jgi:hypothetical protein